MSVKPKDSKSFNCLLFKVEIDRYHFFETVTDICPVANIRLATDTDIPKFAYRYICRYKKLFRIAYSPDLRQSN